MANRYRELQQEKEEAQAETLLQLEEKNRLMDGINARLEKEVAERTAEIHAQKEELASRNKDIVASIQYAKRIQGSILPSSKRVKEIFPDSFIFFRPRDIVSGDFYWVKETTTSDGRLFKVFVAADCTGHGVPGAFVSIVGYNFLELGGKENNVNTPAEALDFLNVSVNDTFNREDQRRTLRDGMDIAMCAIESSTRMLSFAGAKNPVYVIRKCENGLPEKPLNGRIYAPEETAPYCLIELKGDKQPIGAYVGNDLKPFTNQQFQLEKGDSLYVFSDGYPDQFGGPNGRKYMYKSFKRLLLSIQEQEMADQRNVLASEFDEWTNRAERTYNQIDDVLVFGVRIT